MKPLSIIIILSLVISLIILCSFDPNNKSSSEYTKLQKLEQQALKKNIVREYVYDLTNKKGCNKTRIKYLGSISSSTHTGTGKGVIIENSGGPRGGPYTDPTGKKF